MTVMGADKSTGDILTIVTVDDQSRVKLFDMDTYTPPSPGIVEYVATFPNVTVNVGEVYHACILSLKDLNLKCDSGQNSPAHRPEFIDITLGNGADTTSPSPSEDEGEVGRNE